MTLTVLRLSLIFLLFLGLLGQTVQGICSVEHCNDPKRCVLSKDQRRCKCVMGYYSEQCDKNAHIKVMCGRDYIAIRAEEDFFKYHSVPLESLHLPNKSCRAQREVIDGVSYFMSRISKEKYLTCGGKLLEKNLTHISYTLSLLSDPQVIGNIIRNPVIKMDYTCIYPYIRRVSLPFPIVPFSRLKTGLNINWEKLYWGSVESWRTINETVMRVDELDATIRMMLYTDHTYTKAFSSAPTIELRDKVFVEVAVTEPADFFLLRVNECWATQSSQPNASEGSAHTLLQNGCVKDQTVSFLRANEQQAGRNGETPTVRYSFDMFRFTAGPDQVYLHCTVQLCEPDDLKSCKPNCNSISKREAVRPDPIQSLLSYGPIQIEMPDRPPSSLLTVVLPVAAVWTVGFFLIILIAVAKAGSRRLTQMDPH